MTEHRARGLFLSRAPFREHDLRATLLTEHGARLELFAPGAQRSSRRFASGLSPLVLYETAWTESRKGLRLDDATVVRAWPALLTDLRRNAAATIATGVAAEVAEPAPGDASLFLLLGELYGALSTDRPEHACALLVRFVFEALAHAGTAIALDRCVRCDTPAPDAALVTLDPREGGVVCRGCGGGPYRMSAADRGRLRGVIAGARADADGAMLAVVARVVGDVAPGVAAHVTRSAALFTRSGESSNEPGAQAVGERER